MSFRTKSAKPLIVAGVHPRCVKQGVEIEGQPVFFAGHVEIVAVVAHGVLLHLLLRAGMLLLVGAVRGGTCEVVICVVVVGVGVADGRHDCDVAVVWIVVSARNAS